MVNMYVKPYQLVKYVLGGRALGKKSMCYSLSGSRALEKVYLLIIVISQ